jgi:hypothetical protein
MIHWGNVDTLAALRAIVRETEHLDDATRVIITMTAQSGEFAHGGISVAGRMFPEGRG